MFFNSLFALIILSAILNHAAFSFPTNPAGFLKESRNLKSYSSIRQYGSRYFNIIRVNTRCNYNIMPFQLSKNDEEDKTNNIFETSSATNTGHEDDIENQNRKKERAMLSLGTIGLNRNEADDFLTTYPQLYTEVDNLALRILYFQNEMGIPKSKLYQMIMKQPGLTATSFLDDELKSTIEVLQSELSLTTDEVWKLTTESFPQIMRYNRSDLRRKLTFYRFELKLTDKEIKRLVVIQPAVLRHLPSELQDKLDTFQTELDCTSEDMKAMILKFPLLLTYNTQSKLRPCLQFIKQSEIGIGLGLLRRAGDPSTTSLSSQKEKEALIKTRVKTIILQYPNLLAFSIENNIKPTILFLRKDVGLSLIQIGKVVWRFPDLLGLSIEKNLRPKIQYLQKSLNITSKSTLATIVARDPRILGFNILQNFPEKLKFFINELHFSIKELRDLVTKRPQLLTLNISSNIKPKIDYYRNECDYLTIEEIKEWILKNPAELNFNLEKRIKPRMILLKENDVRLLKDTPWNIISKNEKSFDEW